MKHSVKICIGHAAYKGINAQKVVTSKTAAVAELMTRGIVRSVAHASVAKVMAHNYGSAEIAIKGSFAVVEVRNWSK